MIATKPRDTGNPLNDMTGISGGKPLPKGTPAPKEMQLPIPGVDWRKFLVDLQINPDEVQPWRIEQEAPDDTRFTTPVIDGPFPGDPGIGPDSVPTPTEQYYNPVQTIAELNQLQIKALEGIPSDLKKRSPTERLQIMRDITEKVKGLA